jgi:hypothetical protein
MHLSQLEELNVIYAFLSIKPYYVKLILTKECPES